MKTLYFNTYDIESSCNGEHEAYEQYCRDFAKYNNAEFRTYSSVNGYDDELESGEYIDGDNNSASGLRLWDDYCSNEPFVIVED